MNPLAISENASQLADIAKAVTGIEGLSPCQTYQGSLAGLQALPAKGDVHLLVLDCTNDPHAKLAELERIMPLYAGVNVILVVAEESSDILLRALRIGVREVIKPPIRASDISDAVRRIDALRRTHERFMGKLVAFISCKGGSGATFIAVNLGHMLASAHGKQVLLIDLNLQFGDAVLFLSDRRPPATVADVVRDIDRLDTTLLRSSTVEVLPNFCVLAAPEDPTQAREIKPGHVEALLRFARTQFDFVILDVGRSLDAASVQALDNADQIYPVFQLTMPFIRDGKRLLSLFRSLGYPREKIRPLVNRYDPSSDLTLDDLESAVASKVFATIPNDFKPVAASVNQGVPIERLARNSPVTRGLQKLCGKLLEQAEPAGGGWFSRLIGRN